MKTFKLIRQRQYYKRTPILETERLILRPLKAKDAQEMFKWLSDERVTKYMTYSTYNNVDRVKYLINEIIPNSKDSHWGFVLKETNQLIGSGSIYFSEKHDAWNFGYNLNYDYWGNGYATEAAKRMIKFAYDELGARDFCATHAADNPASGRVIEKCGLKFVQNREYSKNDGSQTFKAKFYKIHLD